MSFSFTKRGLVYPLVFCTGLAVGLSTNLLRWQASEADPHVSAIDSPETASDKQAVASRTVVANGLQVGADISASVPGLSDKAGTADVNALATDANSVATVDTPKEAPLETQDLVSLDDGGVGVNTKAESRAAIAAVDNDVERANVRLLENFASQADPSAEAFSVAQKLASQFNDDRELLDFVFERDWPTQQHLHALLGGIGLFTDEATRVEIRDYALNLSQSPQQEEQVEGLAILSAINNGSDPKVRQRLLDVGWTDSTSAALLQVADGLNPALVPPAEREEVISLLTDMAQSNTDTDVRASAIYRLGEWERGSENFSTVVANALSDNDPDIRIAGIYGLSAQGSLSPEQRSQLLEIVQRPEEHASVRMSAAEALSLFQLSEQEYQLVASTLTALNVEVEK